jgi:hypothetical protein
MSLPQRRHLGIPFQLRITVHPTPMRVIHQNHCPRVTSMRSKQTNSVYTARIPRVHSTQEYASNTTEQGS